MKEAHNRLIEVPAAEAPECAEEGKFLRSPKFYMLLFFLILIVTGLSTL